MDADDSGLAFDFLSGGRNGTGTLTARLNGEAVHVESLNIGKSRLRGLFLDKLCAGRPGLDRKALTDALLKLAADVAKPSTAPPSAEPAGLPEVDLSSIARPERFIAPEVSGLCVPAMTAIDDHISGRWFLYLRWADGKRDQRPLSRTIDLPGGRRLFIHPEPSAPSPTIRPGWSSEARRRWLAGEPSPEPCRVFKALCEAFACYLDFSPEAGPGAVATLSLWTLLSYVYPVFDALPYLFIGGPLGSGKSRVFDVLSRLVFRPLSSSNMTAPAMFRTLHDGGGVLLLDEAERLRNTQDPATGEILSMLLAGYKRGGQATRLEPIGERGFRTVHFQVFGPKAVACISGLPPALASRCITITMFRAAPGSDMARRRIDAEPERWQRLRDDLHAVALEHGSTWLGLPAQSDVCRGLSGRDYELWQPLLALAAWLETCGMVGLLRFMQGYATETTDAAGDDQVSDADETLLRLLADRRRNLETPQPRDLLAAAVESDPNVFRTWSAKGVSNALRRYGITTREVHGRKVYRTDLAALARVQLTYRLSLGIQQPETETQTL